MLTVTEGVRPAGAAAGEMMSPNNPPDAPREEEQEENKEERRRMTYSREALLAVRRRGSSESCRRDELPAGIAVCKDEVEAAAALLWGSEATVLEPSHTGAGSRSKTCAKNRAPRSAAPAATVKTRLCKNYDSPGGCKWGHRCYFAHGEDELGKPMGPWSSFKTRMCESFAAGGSCAFGDKCHFAHGQDELRKPGSGAF